MDHVRATAARLAFWLGTLLWVVAPLAALVVLARREDPTDGAPPRIRWAAVGRGTQPATSPVAVTFVRAPAPSLVAPASMAGTVQRVELAPGRRLATGDRVLLVDNVWRLVTAVGPFPRPLRPNDGGPDVAALNELLRALHLPSGGGDRFTADTGHGVADLADQIGAGAVSQFDPAWTIYLPGGTGVVDAVQVQPGMAVPSGQPVATLARSLRSVEVAPAEGGDGTSVGTPTTLGAEAQLLVAGRRVGSLPKGTALPVQLADPALLRALVPLAPAEDDEQVDGVLITPPPAGAVQVPVAAVYADANARSCVRWRSAPGRPGGRRRVDVVDSSSDVAQVTGLPAAARQVELDPPVPARRSC